jgi:hypothetical protein
MMKFCDEFGCEGRMQPRQLCGMSFRRALPDSSRTARHHSGAHRSNDHALDRGA